jgi:hypothetical protein
MIHDGIGKCPRPKDQAKIAKNKLLWMANSLLAVVLEEMGMAKAAVARLAKEML